MFECTFKIFPKHYRFNHRLFRNDLVIVRICRVRQARYNHPLRTHKCALVFIEGEGDVVVGECLGYLESVYNPALTTQEGLKHATKALRIAMKRDSATGDNITLVAITKKGFKEYTNEELDRLLK